MRPRKPKTADHDDLFRARLDQIINLKHALVALADKIDWTWLDEQLADCFSEKGRPAEPVRFMIGMFLLKHTYGLSDEQVWERWVHDPYFQYFTGEVFFQHDLPHERSGLSHWRKRIGDRLDILLAETLRIAHDSGALKKNDLARVTIDTTVQPKNVAFPTDAKLLETAIRHRGRHRPLQDRRPSRPKLPQGPPRRSVVSKIFRTFVFRRRLPACGSAPERAVPC